MTSQSWRTTVRHLTQRKNVTLLAACVTILFIKLLLLCVCPTFYRRFLAFRYANFNKVPSPDDLNAAKSFLAHYRWPGLRATQEQPKLAIAIVTVFRDHVRQQYFDYTLRTLLLGLEADLHRGSVKIVICNGDHIPGRDAYLKQIRGHLSVLKPPVINLTAQNKRDPGWRFEKERHDYVACLNETLTKLPTAGHLLLLEDDAPIRLSAHAPFLATLRHFIDQAGQHGGRRFAFIKLYHPPRLLGYLQPEWDRHLECAAIIGIVITVLRLGQWLYSPVDRFWRRIESHISWPGVIACLLLLLYTLDRYWLLEIRALSKYLHLMVPAPFCCTPGIVFQRQSATEAVKFIARVQANSKYGKDAALYDYHRSSGLPAWYIQPNLVQHIGLTSTLHSDTIASTSL